MPDRTELDAVIKRLSDAITKSCAGGITGDEGCVQISLLGMCASCSYRALNMGVTLRPAIEAVDGVTRLTEWNSGMSHYADERIARAFAGKCSRITC